MASRLGEVAKELTSFPSWTTGIPAVPLMRHLGGFLLHRGLPPQAVVKHPVQTAEAVYAHFGLTLSAAARDAMRALHAQGAPAPARPAHRYALSDFGLTDDQVDDRFGSR
jgi:hypothetical protein